MPDFSEQLAADMEGAVDDGELSVEITYTPLGGEPKVINAAVLPSDTIVADDEHGETKIETREIIILTDSEKGIAEPAVRDSITYDSQDWQVATIGNKGFGKVTLSIETGSPQSKHHETHKRKLPT